MDVSMFLDILLILKLVSMLQELVWPLLVSLVTYLFSMNSLEGFPSVGKSTLMSKLTGTHSEVAAYECKPPSIINVNQSHNFNNCPWRLTIPRSQNSGNKKKVTV